MAPPISSYGNLLKSLLDFALMITLGNVLEEYRMYKCERERNMGGERSMWIIVLKLLNKCIQWGETKFCAAFEKQADFIKLLYNNA